MMTQRHMLILIYNEALLLDIAGPLEILAHAQLPDGTPAYRITLVAPEVAPTRTSHIVDIVPHASFDDLSDTDLDTVDTLLIAGGQGSRTAMFDPAILAFVQRCEGRVRRFATICTGAFVLAAAGLLDGRRATTHWAWVQKLQEAFPAAEIDADALFVRDGPIWSSAGVTAGMDLALALVEEDLGREESLKIAQQLVMYLIRPGGQSQFSAELAAQAPKSGRIAKVCQHILDDPGADHSIPELSGLAAMSTRSFARHFTAETGQTPGQLVARARLDLARRLLSEGDLCLDRVAATAGFGSLERMRRTFVRQLGVTPSQYRERFRRPAPARQTDHAPSPKEEVRYHA